MKKKVTKKNKKCKKKLQMEMNAKITKKKVNHNKLRKN